jgi:hypothetical protein
MRFIGKLSTKQAGWKSEIASTMLNPVEMVASLPAAAVSAVTPTRTRDEQVKAEKETFKNLIPGRATYNWYKRLGHSIRGEGSPGREATKRDAEDKKKEPESKKEEPKEEESEKEASISKLVKSAGIEELWNKLTPAQRNTIIGGGLGAGIGGTFGAVVSEDNKLRNALLGAGLVGTYGAVRGHGIKPDRDAIADNLIGVLEDVEKRYEVSPDKAKDILVDIVDAGPQAGDVALGAGLAGSGYGVYKLLKGLSALKKMKVPQA